MTHNNNRTLIINIKIFIDTFKSIIRCLMHSKLFPTVNNIKFPNDSSCYILGNGPSLTLFLENQPSDVNSNTKICVNDFVKSEYFENIRPEIYIIADLGYWIEETYDEMKKQRSIFLNLLLEKTKWPMKLIIPYFAFKTGIFQGFLNKNINITLYYYNLVEFKGSNNFENYFFKNYFGMPRAQNILIPSILLSINFGFKNINLVGVDHSWTEFLFVNSLNQVCLKDSHFYDKNEASMQPWLKDSGEIYKMHEILRDLAFMFEGYHRLSKYSKYRGTNIMNLTLNSYIDAFDKQANKLKIDNF